MYFFDETNLTLPLSEKLFLRPTICGNLLTNNHTFDQVERCVFISYHLQRLAYHKVSSTISRMGHRAVLLLTFCPLFVRGGSNF